MGGIGRNLAKKMEAFGMRSIYHNRRKLEAKDEGGAEYVSFDELLARSDVLSLNLPLNVSAPPSPFLLLFFWTVAGCGMELDADATVQKNTRHIISTAEFAKMKKGVVIVNTARGAVMDEDALVKALDSGHVLSAGLDVFEEEPKVHPGLVANPNVLLLPHMGTWSVETQVKMEEWCIGNVRSGLEKGKLMSPVPEHASLQ